MQASEDSRQQAERYNQQFAKRVRRWRLTRAALTALFAAAGGLVWWFTGNFVLALPFFLLATMLLVLFLGALNLLRDIDHRKWNRITPYPSRNSPIQDETESVDSPAPSKRP